MTPYGKCEDEYDVSSLATSIRLVVAESGTSRELNDVEVMKIRVLSGRIYKWARNELRLRANKKLEAL